MSRTINGNVIGVMGVMGVCYETAQSCDLSDPDRDTRYRGLELGSGVHWNKVLM